MMSAPPSRATMALAQVLVVGDAMLDRYWFGAVDRISPEAPVPVVRVNREEERLGGAANVALNVKTLGTQATLLTVVGDDEPARKLRGLLEKQGVTALLGHDPQLYTIVKLRVIGRAQQLIRVDFENQPDHEVLGAMLADYERVLGQHGAVLFSDYGKGGLEHIPKMIQLAVAAGKPVLVRKLLRVLCETFEGRPVGLGTLADAVGESADTIEDVYEPYLLQEGLLQRTPRGRQGTARAFRHLGLTPATGSQQGLF